MKYCPDCSAPLRETELDGQQRLRCSRNDCAFVHWQNPVPVVAGLVRLGTSDEYVLARNAGWPEGMFSMISGYLERGETPEAAIARELEEELGLTATDVSLVGHYIHEQKNQLIIAFQVTAQRQISLGDEISDVRLLPARELLAGIADSLLITRQVVRDLGLARIP